MGFRCLFLGMSHLFLDEKSQASVWWDKFANFSWRTDWTQVIIIGLLSALGVVAIKSAGSYRQTTFATSQMIFIGIGWIAYWVVASLDYRKLRVHARRIYLIGILLLIPVSLCALLKVDLGVFIRSINGARRWMDFGPFSIQPSEFAKVSALIFIAALLALNPIGPVRSTWLTVLKVLGAGLLPFGLIFVQPDLGSALIYLPLSFALLYVAGLSSRFFLVAGLSALILGAVVTIDLVSYAAKISAYAEANPSDRNPAKAIRGKYEETAWFVLLKDYQRERLLSFVAPAVIDPRGLGATWNVKQAKIAVGRGAFNGQGIGNGSQAKFGYLPEAAAHNDFLFSGMAEEIGFKGGVLVVAAFALLFWRVVRTALRTVDRFGSLLAIGAAAILGTHVVINIGMNIDLMPVTGVPLPFLSYGGSFVLSCFLLLGLVQSVHRHSVDGGDHNGSSAAGSLA
jgi:rod shape determining protein RodA